MGQCDKGCDWRYIKRYTTTNEDSIGGFIWNTLTLSDTVTYLNTVYQCAKCKEYKTVKRKI